MGRVWAIAAAATLMVLPIQGGAAQAADLTRNGPLLTYDSLTTLSGSSSPLPWSVSCDAQFSPSGAAVAEATATGSVCGTGPIVVHRAGSSDLTLDVPGEVMAFGWSPDSTQLAVVATVGSVRSVLRVPLDGGAPQTVFSSDYLDFFIQTTRLSWRAAGGLIAFTADSDPLGNDYDESQQVFTVPAAGGTPEPWSAPAIDPRCGNPDLACDFIRYDDPQWSPDGTRLLVTTREGTLGAGGGYTDASYSSLIAKGATAPLHLRQVDTSSDEDPSIVGAVEGIWAQDGTAVLTSVSADGVTYDNRLVDVATKVATPIGYTGYYDDWQPCPTGTCASFSPLVAPPPVTPPPSTGSGTITPPAAPVASSSTRAKVADKRFERGSRVKLTVTVDSATTPTGRISLVEGKKTLKSFQLDAADQGRLVVKLPRLTVGVHKLKVVFAGSSAVSSSTSGQIKVTVLTP